MVTQYEHDSSFVVAFPEPVTIGCGVSLKGKLKPGSLRFDLNLVCVPSGDRAFHVSFRHPKVVRNHSTHPNNWGTEEDDGVWPIKASGEFEIGLHINENYIVIYVDGKEFEYFRHRLPYSKITHFDGSAGAVYTSIIFGKTTDSANLPTIEPLSTVCTT